MTHRKKKIEPAGAMLSETQMLLRNRPAWLTLQIIAYENHPWLPYPWLLKLNNDPDCRPAVHRVERLLDYLRVRVNGGPSVSTGTNPLP